jgi:hypothetical protein
LVFDKYRLHVFIVIIHPCLGKSDDYYIWCQQQGLHEIPGVVLDGIGDVFMGYRNGLVIFLVCIGMMTAFSGGCAATKEHESTGQYFNDSIITTKIKTEILYEPTLKSHQIDVKTYQGVVQLSGSVDSEGSVKKAGEIAGGIEGVKSVKNDLIIK